MDVILYLCSNDQNIFQLKYTEIKLWITMQSFNIYSMFFNGICPIFMIMNFDKIINILMAWKFLGIVFFFFFSETRIMTKLYTNGHATL